MTVLPAALLAPLIDVVRRHARQRQLTPLVGWDWNYEAWQRQYTASEVSLTLLTEYVLGDGHPRHAEPVNVNEPLQLAIHTLLTLIQTATPSDQVLPQLRLVPGRRWLLPSDTAHTLVQLVLTIIAAAFADDALFVVVTLPHRDAESMVIEVEADVGGIAEMPALMESITHALTACAGTVSGVRVPEHAQAGSCIQIRLPA